MRMLYILTILVAAGCGEKNEPEPLSKTKSPLSEKVQHPNQDSKAKVRTPIWEFETGGFVESSPAIGSDGTVYVGSYDKKLYAINGKSGAKLWEFEMGSSVHSSPAIGSDDTIYVGLGYPNKKLYAINGKTGGKLWEFKTGSSVVSSPAIGSDGTVYVGSSDKKLYAIKTDSTGLAKSPWPMRGQNPQHTGRAPATQ